MNRTEHWMSLATKIVFVEFHKENSRENSFGCCAFFFVKITGFRLPSFDLRTRLARNIITCHDRHLIIRDCTHTRTMPDTQKLGVFIIMNHTTNRNTHTQISSIIYIMHCVQRSIILWQPSTTLANVLPRGSFNRCAIDPSSAVSTVGIITVIRLFVFRTSSRCSEMYTIERHKSDDQ